MEIARALTIAGSDSGGGAGIQADIKTFSALGVYGASVITALTAQNTCGVEGVSEVSANFVTQQLNSVCSDIQIDAVKIGMLANKDIVTAVVAGIRKFSLKPVVVDPVMVAQSGDRLLTDDAVDAIKNQLLPLADIITPNLPEAAVLLQVTEDEIIKNPWEAAQGLLDMGGKDTTAVLLKGGHDKGLMVKDYLVTKGHKELLEKERIETTNTHGTGCTLSAAICTYLARGMSIAQAVRRADVYLQGAIQAAVEINLGKGNGPVHHFYRNTFE